MCLRWLALPLFLDLACCDGSLPLCFLEGGWSLVGTVGCGWGTPPTRVFKSIPRATPCRSQSANSGPRAVACEASLGPCSSTGGTDSFARSCGGLCALFCRTPTGCSLEAAFTGGGLLFDCPRAVCTAPALRSRAESGENRTTAPPLPKGTNDVTGDVTLQFPAGTGSARAPARGTTRGMGPYVMRECWLG